MKYVYTVWQAVHKIIIRRKRIMRVLIEKRVVTVRQLVEVKTGECFRMAQLPERQLYRYGFPDMQEATPETLISVLQVIDRVPKEVAGYIGRHLANGWITLTQKEALLAGNEIKSLLVTGANFHSFSPSRSAEDRIHVRAELRDMWIPYYGEWQEFFKGDFLLVRTDSSEKLHPFIYDPP
jgi:hypothetical protein